MKNKRGEKLPTVFIADNDPDIVDAFKRELQEQEGAAIEVLSANSGTATVEAIRQLENSSQEPDAILLDIHMDGGGIMAAATIQTICPMADIAFVTAFRDVKVEMLAEKSGIRARWIDKDGYWLERAVSFAREAILKRRLSEFHLQVREWAHTEQIDPAKLDKLLRIIPPSAFGLVPPVPKSAKVEDPAKVASADPLTLSEVLFNLRVFFHQLEVGFEDLTQRHFAFKSLRAMACDQLWQAAEAKGMDRYFLQMADQLIAAVQELEAETLRPQHLKALQTTFFLFEKPDLTKDEVLCVEQMWEAGDVETLPSFGELLKNWRESYGIEEEVVPNRKDQHGGLG